MFNVYSVIQCAAIYKKEGYNLIRIFIFVISSRTRAQCSCVHKQRAHRHISCFANDKYVRLHQSWQVRVERIPVVLFGVLHAEQMLSPTFV